MSDEFDEEEAKPLREIPTWPNLPGVPMDQRRRAFCLACSLESLPQTSGGKAADIAKTLVAAAMVFDDYLTETKTEAPKGLKLVKE